MSSYRLQRSPAWMRAGRVLALATPLLFAACGGGGGGDSTPVNPNSYDLDAAMTRAYANGASFTGLKATASNGAVITLGLTLGAGADAVFEGTLRKVSLQTITVSAPGLATETTSATEYYSTTPFRTYGSIDDAGNYGLASATGNLPTAARVGDTGPLSTQVFYADASKATVTMSATNTWEVQSDGTASTAWACSKTVAREVGSAADLVQNLCFRINTAGDVSAAKFTMSLPTETLEFK